MTEKPESGLAMMVRQLRETPPQTQEEYDAFLEALKPLITLKQMGRIFGIIDSTPDGVRRDLDAIDATTLAELELQFGGAAGFARAMRDKREIVELEEQLMAQLTGYQPSA